MRRGRLNRVLSLFGIRIERFTDRIREAVAYADIEARRLNHESVDTEHLLLGFIREGTGVGAKAMQNLGVDLTVLENELNKVLKAGPKAITKRRLSQTRLAKQVIISAIEESHSLDLAHVGTEHLLL